MEYYSSSKPQLHHHHIIIFTLLIIITISTPAAAQLLPPPPFSDLLPPPPPSSDQLPPPSQFPGGGGVNARCTIDISRLAVCTPLVGIDVGSLTTRPCCGTLLGLVDMEATVCLCMALRANVLGIHLDIPLALNLVLSTCYSSVPHYSFQCSIS